MKKRLLMAVATLLLTALTVQAVPAKPGVKKTVKLADGNTIELTLRGDEHYSFYKDAVGTPYQIVNGIAQKVTPEEITTTWTARKKANLNKAAGNNRRAASNTRRIGEPSPSTTGTHKGLVILLEFNDVKFSIPTPKETYQRVFNEPGYNEEGMAGSVRDYFLKQSYNQLTIDFDVVGPYSTAASLAYYGAPVIKDGKETQHDTNAAGAIKEAVEHVIQEPSLNFADYDWDGDGEVDQVFIIFAGYSQAQGADANCIWPHESHLKGWGYNLAGKDNNGNDVAINTYGCASELRGKQGTEMDGIGTACHEFSHCLGLPDMYDTDYSDGYGMAYWDIMDSGSYLDNSRTPSGYTSYERWFSGWMVPTEISSMTRITDMKPLATHAQAYVLYNEATEKSIKGEYYLLENRQPVDFDKELYGHGLLILHVDYKESAWKSNEVNDDPTHQRLTVIPADNEFSLTGKGLAGDPWPGYKGNTALTNFTSPAATLFNANVDGQKLMSKAIDNITENETAMTVSFVACRPELAKPDDSQISGQANGTSYTVTWPAVAGAVGYELELTANTKQAATPEEALLYENDMSKFYSKSTGFSDISTKMGDYGMSGWSGSQLYTSPNKLRFGTSKATGNLQSPNNPMTESAAVTVVLGMAPFTAGTPVTGKVQYGSRDRSDNQWTINEQDFTVTADGKQVFNFKDKSYAYYLKVIADAQMYLNYIAIYDGTWTAEQLGLASANARTQAPRRATTVKNYETNTNSYTFEGLSANNNYSFRIRTLGEENTVSQWTEEKSFDIGTSGINAIVNNSTDMPHYYDLQGREVTANTKGLLIRKQGNSIKKVLSK